MSFDFNLLAEGHVTETVKLSRKVTVTVRELPAGMLLKFKRLRGLIASAAARFTQSTPLGSQSHVKESVPLKDDQGKLIESFTTTETSTVNSPEEGDIDKAIEVKQKAIADAAEVLMDDEICFDLLRVSVVEFADSTREDMFDDRIGLSVRDVIAIVTSIASINNVKIDDLGNFFSRLKQKSS